MKNIKISEENKLKLFDVINEIIEKNNELKGFVHSKGVNKWAEFSQNSGACKYREQFDDADFEEHFDYSPERAVFETKCEFVIDSEQSVLLMIEAYLMSLANNG